MLHCAGVIVFNCSLNKTILVETKRGNLGFPKGKQNKNENYKETALRELQEETGIQDTQIKLLPGTFDGLSLGGNPSIRYFVGILDCKNTPLCTFDPTELKSVNWYDLKGVNELIMLRQDRKKLLNQVHKYVHEYV